MNEQEKTEQNPDAGNPKEEPLIPPPGEGAARIGPYTRKDLTSPEGQIPSEEKKEEDRVSYEILEFLDKPGSLRQYKVRVPKEEFDKRQSEMIKDLKKSVVIDGFRKGKAPEQLLKRRFRKELKEDVIDKIVPIVADDILKKEGLEKFLDPVLEEAKGEEGEDLEILFHVEILPKIEVKSTDYTGMEVAVKKQKITDEILGRHLEELQKRSAVFEPKEGPVEETDGTVLNIHVEDEHGKKIRELEHHDALIQYPANYLPREVNEALKGKEKGSSLEVFAPLERKNPKGEVVSSRDKWKLEILEVKKCVLPKLDDEFAKDMGDFKTLEDFKTRIRTDMEQSAEMRAQEDAFDAIMRKIMEQKPFDPPATLVEHYKRGLIGEDLQRLRQLGLSFKDMKLDADQYLERKQKDADQMVKSSFLIREILRAEKIEVTDQDLEAELARIAEREGRKPLAIRAKLEAEGKLESFKDNIMNEKIKKFLIEHNTVKYEDCENLS